MSLPADAVPALPCGAWPSPLLPEQVAAGAVALGYAEAVAGRLYWTEGRPAERGRTALLCRQPDGSIAEPLGADAHVRSRVHEYGGTPYLPLADGLVYAQFEDQRLRWRQADGQSPLLTPPGCRYADFCAAPDGASIVAVREDHRHPGEPANAVVRLRLDGEDGAGQLLYGDSDFVAWPRICGAGRQLAWVAWDHPAMPWDATRLMVARLGSDGLEQVRTVAGGPAESVLEPQWADDGSLYFLSDRSGWWNLCRWQDGAVATLTAVTSLAADIGGPLWNLGTRSYLLLANRLALLRVSQGGRDSLQLLNLDDASVSLLSLPFVSFGSLGLLDDRTAFTIAAAEDDLPVLLTLDLRDGSHSVVRRSGDAPLASAAVSRAQAIAFATAPGADGAAHQAHAWFYPPCLPGQRPPEGELPPLIVLLHGGPTACASAALKPAVQFWTSRGLAVVDVNYGGSSGFGRPYRQRLNGQWGVVDLQDAIAAVDHLAAAGRIDGRRVAIRGGSAGGFTVLCGLAFSQRFAAGINYFGVADLESLARDTHKFESRYLDGLVAPLPQGRAIYQARSPVRHMGQCRAALLTFQGSDDMAVPPQQSRDISAAARAAGCPVAYLEFAGEGHGFRQGPNIVRAWQAELVFLGQVFNFVPAGELPALAIDNLRPA